MSLFSILAILVSLSALFSFVNYLYLRLPMTIGLTVIAIAVSLGIIGLDAAGLPMVEAAERMLSQIDFDEALLEGMLSYLLFAGALHIDLQALKRQKWVIGTLASFGILCSTFLIGSVMYYVLSGLGIEIPLVYALLFGALISPTDPIAVLSILKTADAPKSLETKIAGESLFNDGVGVVVFLVLMEVARGGAVTASGIAMLFAKEAVGGALFGLIAGWLAFWMLKRVDDYTVEVLITLALVTGGYALAMALHLSGPIAVVIAGLLIGNPGRSHAMSQETRRNLDMFWELIDEILNAVLFLLIGLELLLIEYSSVLLAASAVAVVCSLSARFLVVGGPVMVMRQFRDFSPNAIRILTWGGLRGGISVALALSLPPGREREIILAVTYGVVVFSIVVQGLTIGRLLAPKTEAG